MYHVDMFRESNETLQKYRATSYLMRKFRVLTEYSLRRLHFVQVFNFSLASPDVLQFASWGAQCSNLEVLVHRAWHLAFEFRSRFPGVYSYPEFVLNVCWCFCFCGV